MLVPLVVVRVAQLVNPTCLTDPGNPGVVPLTYPMVQDGSNIDSVTCIPYGFSNTVPNGVPEVTLLATTNLEYVEDCAFGFLRFDPAKPIAWSNDANAYPKLQQSPELCCRQACACIKHTVESYQDMQLCGSYWCAYYYGVCSYDSPVGSRLARPLVSSL